jgi:hypothetical protein
VSLPANPKIWSADLDPFSDFVPLSSPLEPLMIAMTSLSIAGALSASGLIGWESGRRLFHFETCGNAIRLFWLLELKHCASRFAGRA